MLYAFLIISFLFIVSCANFTSKESTQSELAKQTEPKEQEAEPAEQKQSETAHPEIDTSDSTTVFDAKKVKAGDKIGNMTIKSLEVIPGTKDYPVDIVQAKFSGQVEITGVYEHTPKNWEFFGDTVCFTPDEESASKLPQLEQRQGEHWFCFENQEAAAQALGAEGEKGRATIVIADFFIDYRPTETVDRARLVQVIEKQKIDNFFDIKKAKIGDQIMGMKIKDITVKEDPHLIAQVKFAGQLTLTGRYEHFPKDVFPSGVCFIPNRESYFQLPSFSTDGSHGIFCFNNSDAAEKELGGVGSTGKATIVIDNYEINHHLQSGNAIDRADLIRVVKKEEIQP